jgi:NO-binding membrane sensor protein with MHYT domain
MQRVLSCLTNEHDRGLLALAVVVCLLGIVAAIGLVGVRSATEQDRTWKARRLLPAASILGAGMR